MLVCYCQRCPWSLAAMPDHTSWTQSWQRCSKLFDLVWAVKSFSSTSRFSCNLSCACFSLGRGWGQVHGQLCLCIAVFLSTCVYSSWTLVEICSLRRRKWKTSIYFNMCHDISMCFNQLSSQELSDCQTPGSWTSRWQSRCVFSRVARVSSICFSMRSCNSAGAMAAMGWRLRRWQLCAGMQGARW